MSGWSGWISLVPYVSFHLSQFSSKFYSEISRVNNTQLALTLMAAGHVSAVKPGGILLEPSVRGLSIYNNSYLLGLSLEGLTCRLKVSFISVTCCWSLSRSSLSIRKAVLPCLGSQVPDAIPLTFLALAAGTRHGLPPPSPPPLLPMGPAEAHPQEDLERFRIFSLCQLCVQGSRSSDKFGFGSPGEVGFLYTLS
mgnify:CR=1 FL=1